MEILQRFPLPRRLAARVWLVTIPSALLSFERRQRIPKLPLGRGRFAGLILIGGGIAAIFRGSRPTVRPDAPARGLPRLGQTPAVSGGLLALTGVGLLLRSLVLIAYALGLGVAFAQNALELEGPRAPGGGDQGSWDYDESQV